MDSMINLRLPSDLLARVDALVPDLDQTPAVRVGARACRSTVLRMALEKGLPLLEAEIGGQTAKKVPNVRE